MTAFLENLGIILLFLLGVGLLFGLIWLIDAFLEIRNSIRYIYQKMSKK